MSLELPDESETPGSDSVARTIAELGLWQVGLLRHVRRHNLYYVSTEAAELLGCPAGELTAADVEATLATLPRVETSYCDSQAALVSHGDRYIQLRQIPCGTAESVFLVEDVTSIIARESRLRQQEREFRGLFENASYGIYRSTFAGRQLRANPALVRLNGYDSEAEMLEGVRDIAREWYVEPNRRQEFFDELIANGKVVDFVSEIYRHKTRERIWISETAWLVHDENGEPKFVEGTLVETTERVRALERARAEALTDDMTGLPNCAAFQMGIDRAIITARPGVSHAVIVIDIDNFKDINDIYGHGRGDDLLVAIGRRLTAIMPNGHFLARLGGDEFGVLVTDSAVETARSAAARIIAALRQPFPLDGVEHVVAASIGIAQFPQHAGNRADLMRNADMALFRVKQSGRGHVCVFDEEFRKALQHRHMLAMDLRGADLRGELELFYQPIVDAKTNLTVGVEALMRWRHPVRGLVSPTEFISVAEDSGLMHGFGAWAIDEACRHATTLPPHIHVAVNVSALQFHSSDLPNVVDTALRRHGVEPGRLELEITESLVLRNESVTLQTLEQLKALGVRIALDDFGTGYSSLSYLQRFAFDKVKIDQSFVRSISGDPVNAAVVRAVLSIGRDLGLAVVAEGIETDAEQKMLVSQGCQLFQGFLYGQPQPFTDAVARLALETLHRLPLADETDQTADQAVAS